MASPPPTPPLAPLAPLPPPHRRSDLWRGVYGPSLLHSSGYAMLGPAIPLYAQEIGIGVGWIGVLLAVLGLAAVITNVPAGLFVARVGGRRAMATGAALSGVAGLALGVGRMPAQLFAAVPLLGIAIALWATSRLAYVAGAAPVEHRGRALALVGGCARVGTTIGPIVGGVVGQALGLPATFYGHAALALLASGVIASQPEATRSEPDPPPTSERALRRIARILVETRHGLATAGGVALALATLRGARRLLIPLWGSALGLDLKSIGLVIGLASAIDMSLFYPVGAVMDRWGRKWTIVPCLLLLATSLAALPFTDGFAGFLAVALLGGLGNGLGSGAVMTMGADLAPPTRSGEFLGVWRLVADSGAVLAPIVVGGLAEAFTLGAAAFAAAAVGGVGAVVMITLVRDGLRHDPIAAAVDPAS